MGTIAPYSICVFTFHIIVGGETEYKHTDKPQNDDTWGNCSLTDCSFNILNKQTDVLGHTLYMPSDL